MKKSIVIIMTLFVVLISFVACNGSEVTFSVHEVNMGFQEEDPTFTVPAEWTYGDLHEKEIQDQKGVSQVFRLYEDELQLYCLEAGYRTLFFDEGMNSAVSGSSINEKIQDGIVLYYDTMPPI